MIRTIGKLAGLAVLWLSSAAYGIEHHPGLESVEASRASDIGVHRLITGRVKRMAGDVQPEASEFVRGRKFLETFSIPAAHSTASLVEFYRQQLSLRGQILFECDGRGCGPSNYWSNQVFERPRLYGPLEYQHYMLARVEGEAADYVMLYFSQRGTGSRYLHVESISGVNESFAADTRLIASMLRLQRRFVFDVEPTNLAAVRDVINEHPEFSLAVVAHAGTDIEESYDVSVARTQKYAQEVKDLLTEMGADTRNVRAVGAGPIAPVERAQSDRLELVKLN
jgi:hypothetical protein